ncbi:hypothetical protein JAAARDRAFT_49605 [Jaapia argillacea MUCL 33604]|uniref:Protein kinase domain-containing protein n=1 Tax=Jaapia argillacea MUCL 33604 TaxID=933084 RepID=A0A067PTL1_9AGAM|nr:hypothetical protein JAAARDRAFT_49605 [Jaapia argillacea MUCL 33604]
MLLLRERNKLRQLPKEERTSLAEKAAERFLEEHCKEPLARVAPNTSCVKVSRYWQGLWANVISGRRGFKASLDVVHTDMVSVWNFNDPDNLLSSREFKEMVLTLIEGLASNNDTTPSSDLPTAKITAIFQAISTAGGPMEDIAGLSSTLIKLLNDTSEMTPETLRCLMGYIVDLTAILQYLLHIMLSKRSKLIWEYVKLAVELYGRPLSLSAVHQDICQYTARPDLVQLINSGDAEKETIRLVRLLGMTLPSELLTTSWDSSRIGGSEPTAQRLQQTARPAKTVSSSAAETGLTRTTALDSRSVGEVLTIDSGKGDDGGSLDLGNSVVITEGPLRGGGFSDVYRGIWDHQGQQVDVAMKKLRVYLECKTNVLKLFRREVKIWSQMNHPNILRFLGFTFLDGSCFYMISPWVHNGDCLRYLKCNPNADRVKLLSQTAQALDYLHPGQAGHPYVHGDLKGDNVLVSAEGNALLNDFGLTRHLERLSSLSMTSSGIPPLGLIQFAAPELFKSETRPTTQSDVYAFGCLIIQIFTGELPFPTMSEFQLMMAKIQREEKPPRPSDPALVVAGLDDHLWELVEECVETDPSSRPTMDVIVQMLG